MSKRSSIKHQATQALEAQVRFGMSKHQAKQTEQTQSPAGIYSVKTLHAYKEQAVKFVEWAKQNHGCRYLEEAKPYADEYLRLERDRGMSASTLKLEASALRKMYEDKTVGASVSLPERSREDFTRSRIEATTDRHFSPEKNRDLVDFCLGVGFRRAGVTKTLGQDVVKDQAGKVWVHTIEKGGRERWSPVVEKYADRVWQLAQQAGPDGFIIQHVHSTADIHSLRHEYARERYRELTGSDYVKYHPDHSAIMQVSFDLGHSREDVVVNNYLQ